MQDCNDKAVALLMEERYFDGTFGAKIQSIEKAPWCGHCQKLQPEYEKLAEVFKSVDNLLIAKIDATANDIDFAVEGFPTIVLFER